MMEDRVEDTEFDKDLLAQKWKVGTIIGRRTNEGVPRGPCGHKNIARIANPVQLGQVQKSLKKLEEKFEKVTKNLSNFLKKLEKN